MHVARKTDVRHDCSRSLCGWVVEFGEAAMRGCLGRWTSAAKMEELKHEA